MDYDVIAQEYKEYSDIGGTDIILGYSAIFDLLGDLEGKKLLDYGCGTGRFCKIAKIFGPDITGVDISGKELEIAKKENEGIIFHKLDGNFRLPENYFDFAVINFVLSAINSKDTVRDILKSIHCSLKPSGKLVILNSNYEKSNGREFMTFRIEKMEHLETGEPVKVFLGEDKSLMVQDYLWLQKDYEEILRSLGYKIDRILEPVANNDSHPWIDEKEFPPFLIISAVKQQIY